MPRTPLPLPLGSYLSEVLPLSARRVINWIPVVSESQGTLNNNILLQRHGLKQNANTASGAGRGQHVMSGVQFSVNGQSLVTTSDSRPKSNKKPSFHFDGGAAFLYKNRYLL